MWSSPHRLSVPYSGLFRQVSPCFEVFGVFLGGGEGSCECLCSWLVQRLLMCNTGHFSIQSPGAILLVVFTLKTQVPSRGWWVVVVCMCVHVWGGSKLGGQITEPHCSEVYAMLWIIYPYIISPCQTLIQCGGLAQTTVVLSLIM